MRDESLNYNFVLDKVLILVIAVVSRQLVEVDILIGGFDIILLLIIIIDGGQVHVVDVEVVVLIFIVLINRRA